MSKNKRLNQQNEPRSDQKALPYDDVASLIKERRKYVDWIAALEAKKEQTAANVYVKVHTDYEERLRVVNEKLETHRGSLAEEQTGLRKKLEHLDSEITKSQERRDEIEIRAQVGELGAAALTEALRTADTGLERLTAERSAVAADLTRVNDFFAATTTGTVPPTVTTPAAPPKKASSFDELSFLNSVVGQVPPQKSGEHALPVRKSGDAKPAESTASQGDGFKVEKEADLSAEKPAKPPVVVPVIEKAVELKPVAPSRPSIAMQQAAMTIEPPIEPPKPPSIVKANESAPSLLEGVKTSPQQGEKPFAANVASNNPLSLKSTGTSDLKTLKCRECGAQNDPSEWYCERCGAELSAM